MSKPNEFSRPVRVETIGFSPRSMTIQAEPAERKALALRFALPAINELAADVSLTRTGEVVQASGRLHAEVTQSCVASGELVPATIDEPFSILFTPPYQGGHSDEEIELSATDCDVVFYEGGSIDLGEAVAETLSLGLNPWPRAPGADAALREAGVKSEAEVGPFAGLAALRDKLQE
jgi:uncharacterized metal-binding protein YceD (DUF177 family)